MSAEHRRIRRWIETDVLGELPPRHRGRLHDHLRSCSGCRAQHDRTISAFRILEGRDCSNLELEQVGGWIHDDLGGDPRGGLGLEGRRWWAWLGSLGAVATLLALIMIQPADEGFQAKGPGSFEDARGQLAISVLCGTPPRPAGESGCALEDRLGFSYRVRTGADRYLHLFGVDERGGVMYYAPTPLDGAVPAVELGRWDAYPETVRLDVNHQPGRVRVYGLLAPVEGSTEQIDAWAAALRDRSSSRGRGRTWAADLPAELLQDVCPSLDSCAAVESAFSIHRSEP
jgi:hypothetical protein